MCLNARVIKINKIDKLFTVLIVSVKDCNEFKIVSAIDSCGNEVELNDMISVRKINLLGSKKHVYEVV